MDVKIQPAGSCGDAIAYDAADGSFGSDFATDNSTHYDPCQGS